MATSNVISYYVCHGGFGVMEACALWMLIGSPGWSIGVVRVLNFG